HTVAMYNIHRRDPLGRVIKERDEAQRLVGARVADSVNAAALRVNHAARLHWQLAAAVGTKAIDLARYYRIPRQSRIVIVPHVGDAFAFNDTVELLRADMTVRAFDRARRDCHFVEKHNGAGELALQHPAHFDDVVAPGLLVTGLHHAVAITHGRDSVDVVKEVSALKVDQVVRIGDGVLI